MPPFGNAIALCWVLCAPRLFFASPFCSAHGPACNRNTPLHYAAACGKTEVARLLIEHKADLNISGADG